MSLWERKSTKGGRESGREEKRKHDKGDGRQEVNGGGGKGKDIVKWHSYINA